MKEVQLQRLQVEGNSVAIPRLIWTAGCCVGMLIQIRNFAVVGDYIQNGEQPENGNFLATSQVTVQNLQQILLNDVTPNFNNVGGPDVRLFPENAGCSDPNNNEELPQFQQGA